MPQSGALATFRILGWSQAQPCRAGGGNAPGSILGAPGPTTVISGVPCDPQSTGRKLGYLVLWSTWS